MVSVVGQRRHDQRGAKKTGGQVRIRGLHKLCQPIARGRAGLGGQQPEAKRHRVRGLRLGR